MEETNYFVQILSWTAIVLLSVSYWFQIWKIHVVKQVMTTIPVLIIIGQIIIHKEDHWHDDDDPFCENCKKELEPFWEHCAYCGTKTSEKALTEA